MPVQRASNQNKTGELKLPSLDLEAMQTGIGDLAQHFDLAGPLLA